MVILIDGSFGEGGGQILRTSLTLSALALKPVKIVNIRAKRSNPGLRPQHLTAVKVIATLTDAEVKGAYVGSMELEFHPKTRRGGKFQFDIGTAGSISLVLQAAIPTMLYANEPVELTIRGGTDVSWSPPIDYMRYVFTHWLGLMGAKISIKVLRRGHYPRGGGLVKVRVEPVTKLKALNVLERGEVISIHGISHAVKLPKHVAVRQAKSAKDYLVDKRFDESKISIDLEFYEPSRDPHLGPGSGIVLWARTTNNCILGADSLGARGKPAERVGREAAEKLYEELLSNAALDSHMGDMIIPFLALAHGNSEVTISKLTMHTYTNIEIVKRILGAEVTYEGELNSKSTIKVKGLAFTG